MAAATSEPVDGIDSAVGELIQLLKTLGRGDLVDRAMAAGDRVNRPATVVCVVGEFKQGKSSLVNGLVGEQICPVDDDLATSALTLVRYGEEAGVVVRRRNSAGTVVAEPSAFEHLADWVSEKGNPANEKQVEQVEISLPSPILGQGLVLVDSPGMGGLGAGHAASTLAFLPFADGLVLVSDASAELSALELELLRRASELCPSVLFAQTKIDLYPEWRRIVALNQAHLAVRNLDLPTVAVSSTLRFKAATRGDPALDETSRFPELAQVLTNSVVLPAKEHAAERSAADVRDIVALVRSGIEEERALLQDPARTRQVVVELEAATARLQHLRGPGARWSVVLGDRVSDLSNTVSHRFSGALRTLARSVDDQIETMKTAEAWEEITRQIQTFVAERTTEAFEAIETSRVAIRSEVAALLRDQDLALPTGRDSARPIVDISKMWPAKGIRTDRSVKQKLSVGMSGLRGAQRGASVLGTMGRFLPTAVSTLVSAHPVLLGAGALFGGMEMAEDRKRKVAKLRQDARQQAKQFLEDVHFEVGNAVGELIRAMQRELRDEFADRLAELQRTCAETAQHAAEDAQRTEDEIRARLATIEESLARLSRVEQLVGEGAG